MSVVCFIYVFDDRLVEISTRFISGRTVNLRQINKEESIKLESLLANKTPQCNKIIQGEFAEPLCIAFGEIKRTDAINYRLHPVQQWNVSIV